MVAYTVYPFKPSGVAPGLQWIEQPGDSLAATEALKLLAEHHSAVRVTVWREDVLVFSGPSAACAAWLKTRPERRALCPAITDPDRVCDPDCGHLSDL